MQSEEPTPSLLPIVVLMLIGLSGYMLWQFDPGLATLGVPMGLIFLLGFLAATKSK